MHLIPCDREKSFLDKLSHAVDHVPAWINTKHFLCCGYPSEYIWENSKSITSRQPSATSEAGSVMEWGSAEHQKGFNRPTLPSGPLDDNMLFAETIKHAKQEVQALVDF